MESERGSAFGFHDASGTGGMTADRMDAPELFERNREAFVSRYPDVWAKLEGIDKPTTAIVEDARTAVNIDLGAGMLYPTPAPEWTHLSRFERRSAIEAAPGQKPRRAGRFFPPLHQ